MAPKKKIKASKIASGDATTATASSLKNVNPLMLAAQECLESIFSLRHSEANTAHQADLPRLQLQGNSYAWPVLGGGTFKDIAQRAWLSPDRLLQESLDMTFAAGLLDDADQRVFEEKYCALEAGASCQLGFLLRYDSRNGHLALALASISPSSPSASPTTRSGEAGTWR